jgi:hypothetical protein
MRSMIRTGLIAGLSVAGSLLFACAAPLAAIAAFAAVRTNAWLGLAVVGMAWMTNQVIGFAVLGYPTDAETLAWGLAVGLAMLLAFGGARVASMMGRMPLAGPLLAFTGSFAAFELSLYGFGLLAYASSDAFSATTIGRIFTINLVAFAGLLVAERALWAFSLRGFGKPVSVGG